jgi:hypothetical protein
MEIFPDFGIGKIMGRFGARGLWGRNNGSLSYHFPPALTSDLCLRCNDFLGLGHFFRRAAFGVPHPQNAFPRWRRSGARRNMWNSMRPYPSVREGPNRKIII